MKGFFFYQSAFEGMFQMFYENLYPEEFKSSFSLLLSQNCKDNIWGCCYLKDKAIKKLHLKFQMKNYKAITYNFGQAITNTTFLVLRRKEEGNWKQWKLEGRKQEIIVHEVLGFRKLAFGFKKQATQMMHNYCLEHNSPTPSTEKQQVGNKMFTHLHS